MYKVQKTYHFDIFFVPVIPTALVVSQRKHGGKRWMVRSVEVDCKLDMIIRKTLPSHWAFRWQQCSHWWPLCKNHLNVNRHALFEHPPEEDEQIKGSGLSKPMKGTAWAVNAKVIFTPTIVLGVNVNPHLGSVVPIKPSLVSLSDGNGEGDGSVQRRRTLQLILKNVKIVEAVRVLDGVAVYMVVI